MGKLVKEGNQVTLQMGFWEKIGSFHPTLKMDLDQIEKIEFIENPWRNKEIWKGVRAPGTGIPGVIMLGTLRNFKGWKAFCAVRGKGPAVVITWKSGEFNSWIISANEGDFENIKRA